MVQVVIISFQHLRNADDTKFTLHSFTRAVETDGVARQKHEIQLRAEGLRRNVIGLFPPNVSVS